jgi:hypothetical protein
MIISLILDVSDVESSPGEKVWCNALIPNFNVFFGLA